MIAMTLEAVAAAVGGTLHGADGAAVVHAVTIDSRAVPPSALFVALRGEVHDGHDYADAAHAAGAVACIAEREIGSLPTIRVASTWAALAALAAHVRTAVAPLVIGVTGSVGKTTTKDLAAAAVATARRTCVAPGSFNNEAGVPLTLLALESGHEVAVVEIGARGVGHVRELAAVARPDVGVVTAVAGVHLEMFGSLAAVATAKAELVEALPATGTAVLNVDDAAVAAMAARTQAAVLRVSAGGGDAELRAEQVTLDRLARARFVAATPWGRADVRLPIAGRHHVTNALLALAAAGAVGVDLHAAAGALETAAVSAWRGEVAEVAGITLLNDAYNANPTSMVAALDTLAGLGVPGRRVAVVGVMAEIGAAHDAEHHRVGAHAAALGLDRLVVVGEGAAPIAAGAVAAGMDPLRVVTVADAAAAAAAVDDLGSGDALLVKASRVGGLERVAALVAERLETVP